MRKVEFPGISLFKNRTRYEIFWGIISWKSTSNLFAWTARQAESEVGVQHWRIINLVEELCSWKSYSICMQINSAVDSEHMQLLGLHDSIRYNKIVYDSLPGPSAGPPFPPVALWSWFSGQPLSPRYHLPVADAAPTSLHCRYQCERLEMGDDPPSTRCEEVGFIDRSKPRTQIRSLTWSLKEQGGCRCCMVFWCCTCNTNRFLPGELKCGMKQSENWLLCC